MYGLAQPSKFIFFDGNSRSSMYILRDITFMDIIELEKKRHCAQCEKRPRGKCRTDIHVRYLNEKTCALFPLFQKKGYESVSFIAT